MTMGGRVFEPTRYVGHVICKVCGKDEEITHWDCEALAVVWKHHRWARENGTHVCEACWDGTKEAV